MQKKLHSNATIHSIIFKKIDILISTIFSNLNKIRENYVVIIVGKFLKKIIKDKVSPIKHLINNIGLFTTYLKS